MPSPHRRGRLLDSLFGTSLRQRRAAARRRLLLEPLEDRRLLATLTFDATGLLHYTGDTASANALTVSLMKSMMTGQETYTIVDPAANITVTDPTNTFSASADKHTVTGSAATVKQIQIDLGGTANTFTLGATDAPIAALTATDTAGVLGDTATVTASLQVAGDLKVQGFGKDVFNNGATPIVVSATGIQDYADPLSLSSDLTLSSAAAANPGVPGVRLRNTVTGGGHALTVSAATAGSEFDDAVSGVTKLLATGPVTFNTGTVTTTGSGQEYQGAVTLSRATVLTDTANGAIKFDSTVDGGGFDLKTASTGTTTFGDAVSDVAALTVAGPADLNGGPVMTTGEQDYQGAVSLSADAMLTSTAATTPGIRFESTVTGNGHLLTATAAAGIEFDDMVSGVTALTVAGPVTIKKDVTTTGPQDYQGAVALGGDVVLTTTTATSRGIRFESTVAGNGHSLSLTATAATTGSEFDDTVSGLTTLTVQGTLAVGTTAITTTGVQDYQGGVTLSTGTTLTSTAPAVPNVPGVRFRSTVAGGGNSLAVVASAAGAEFDMPVTGVTALTVTGPVDLNGGTVTTTGPQDYQGPVSLSADATLTSTTATTPGIRFESTVTGNGHLLSATAAAGVELDDAVSGVTALTVVGPATIKKDVTTTGQQDYQGAVTLGGAVTFTSTAAAAPGVRFRGAVAGGNHPLTVTAAAGGAEFDMAVTGVTALSVTGPAALNGGTITTTGTQTYQGAVTLGANATLTSTAAATPAVRFESTVTGNNHTLSASAANGSVEFDGAVSGVSKLTVTGATDLNGGTVTTTGSGQDYQGAVTLSANALLKDTNNGPITLQQSVAGATFDLATDTGGLTSFAGPVSGVGALSTTGDAGFGPAATVGAGTVSIGGAADLNALSAPAGTPTVLTAGGQMYNGPVTLTSDQVLASSGSGTIEFKDTVNSDSAATPRSLATETDGPARFDGVVGGKFALQNLTVEGFTVPANGSAALNAGGTATVTTVGSQDYVNPVALGDNQLLTSTGGQAITFHATVDSTAAGAKSLTAKTDGTVKFQGVVGGAFALQSLATGGVTAATTRRTELDATGTAVRTVGGQDYGDPVVLGASQALVSTGSGAITFESTVDSDANMPRSLVTRTDGTTTFGGTVGAVPLQALRSEGFLATGNGFTVVGGAVTTSGTATDAALRTYSQEYANALRLAGPTTLTSKVPGTTGTIRFLKTVDSVTPGAPQALTVQTDGTAAFGDATLPAPNGVVGGTGPLLSLTVEGFSNPAFGITDLNAIGMPPGSVTVHTVGNGQDYKGMVILSASAVLQDTIGAITFEQSVTGNTFDLATDTAGVTSFAGPVSGVGALGTTGPANFGTLATVSAGSVSIGGAADLNAVSNPAGTPTILTTGGQTYNGPVTLTADQILASSGDGTIEFKQTVDSDGTAPPHSLITQTDGAATFDGRVGSANPLQSLTTGGFTAAGTGVTNLNAAGAPTVTTTGTQDYSNAVALGNAQALLSQGAQNINFHATVDSQAAGPKALTTMTDGRVIFQGVVGGTFALQSLTTAGVTGATNRLTELDAPGATTVRTVGRQDYLNPVSLGADQTLVSTGAGAITFGFSVDAALPGMQSLSVVSDGVTTFAAPVGAFLALRSLLTSGFSGPAVGTTNLAGGMVVTSGFSPDTIASVYTQLYGNAVLLSTTDILRSIAPSDKAFIVFGSTVDAMDPANDWLDVITPGTAVFHAAVGSTGSLPVLELNTQLGVTQPANAPFRVQKLLLRSDTPLPGGDFDLSQAANQVGTLAAAVNGKIALRDTAPLLTVDTVRDIVANTDFSGIKTNGNDFSAVVDQDFRINQVVDTSKPGSTTLGTISVLVGQNATKPVHITVAANLIATQATFDGTHPLAHDHFNDIFNIAPSLKTPIKVIGLPKIPLPGPGNELDLDLLPNLPGFTDAPTGTRLFAMPAPPDSPLDGSGFYTFTNRATLTYMNIAQLGQLNASAYAYLNAQGLPVVVAQVTQGSVDPNGNPVTAVAQLLNPVQPAQPSQNPFLFSPAVNSPYPAAPPRVTFAFDRPGTVPDLIIAGGAGTAPLITVIDGNALLSVLNPAQSTVLLAQFYAFDPNYLGGVNLATGDLTGKGADAIVAGMANGGDTVRSFAISGPDRRDPNQPQRVVFSQMAGALGQFNPFNGLPVGVQVAVAGATSGSRGVLFVAPGPGVAAIVKTYDGATGAPLPSLTQPMLFPGVANYQGGLVLAATDSFGGAAGSNALLVGMMSGGSTVGLFGFNNNAWTALGQIATTFTDPLGGKKSPIPSGFPFGVGSVAFGPLSTAGANSILVGSIRTHVAELRQFKGIADPIGSDASGFPIAFLNSELQVSGVVNSTSADPPTDAAPTIATAASTTRVIAPGGSDTLGFTVGSAVYAGRLTVTAVSSNQGVLPAAAVLLTHVGNAYTLKVTPPAGTNTGKSTITVAVTDPLGMATTLQFNVIVDTAPTLGPINGTNTVTLDVSQFPYAAGLGASSAAGNPLTYSVSVTGDSLLHDVQQQYQFTGVGYLNHGAVAYVLHSTQPGPGAQGYYLIRPADGALFAYDGSGSYTHTFANVTPIATLGVNTYLDPGLLLNARPPADYATLNALEAQYQFAGVGYMTHGASAYVLHSNQPGPGAQGYYLVRPSDGALFAYDGSGSYAHTFANSSPLATLGAGVYAFPDELINAQAAPALYTQLYQANSLYDLQVSGVTPAGAGSAAKWLYSPILNQYGQHWYTLTVSAGQTVLKASQGYADPSVGAVVATFNTASVYNNPYLLTTATVLPNPAVNASVSPTGVLSIDIPTSTYIGTFKVRVAVSDGLLSAAQTVTVTSTDTAPEFAIQQDGVTIADGSTVTLPGTATFTAKSTAGGKAVTTTASVATYNPLFDLQQQNRFQGLGYYTFGATAYVLSGVGTNAFGNNLYLLKPDGGLYAYDGSGSYAHTFANVTPTANPGASVYADPSLLLNAQPTVDYAQLYNLQQQYQFQGLGAYNFGAPAYVLSSATTNGFGNHLYLLKADGGLYAYDGSGSYAHTFANGTPLATLDPGVFANPGLLINAQAAPALYARLYQAEQQYYLQAPAGGLRIGGGGNAAKLLTSPVANAYGQHGYEITLSPDGTQALLYALNASNAVPAGAGPLAVFDSSVYANPALLTTAKAAPRATGVTANVTGGTVNVNTPDGFTGLLQVSVTASDGALQSEQFFHLLWPGVAVDTIPAQKVSQSGAPLQVALQAANFGNGPVTYSATAVGTSAAYNLQQQYHFTGVGYFTVAGVTAYVLQSAVPGGVNGYYLLGADGGLYAYDGSGSYALAFANRTNRIADLPPAVYATPSLLTNAQPPAPLAAAASVTGSTLTVDVASVPVGTVFEVLVNATDGVKSVRTSFLVTVTA